MLPTQIFGAYENLMRQKHDQKQDLCSIKLKFVDNKSAVKFPQCSTREFIPCDAVAVFAYLFPSTASLKSIKCKVRDMPLHLIL
jgi:hypothetical protein